MARVHAYAGQYDVPVLGLLGTGDQICDYQATKRLIDAWGHPVHDLKLYDGLYHELFNEPEKNDVLADLVAWLQAREHAPEQA
ncbi:MAG: alpha/beta hydrolase [Oligoflexia bacterium]|nr:alpha/beta hydrolase [Oligoflexia bacterium]